MSAPGVSLVEALRRRLGGAPERVVMIDGERCWSAAALDAAACAWAERLAGRARVALVADNGGELVAALCGVLYAGAAVVPLHAASPREELVSRVARFGVDAVVSDRALALALDVPVMPLAPDEPRASPSHTAPYVTAAAGETDDERGDRDALLLGTSGTTGEPRAVAVPYRGLATHAAALVEVLGLGPGDRVLAALPLAHSYGCRMAVLVPLLAGACIVLAQRFSAHATLALVARHRCTWAPLVPTMLSAWSAAGAGHDAHDTSSLRWVLSAGAPLPEAVRVRAEARLGCAVREGYGLTEASFTTLDAPPAAPAPGTVGRPVPGVEVRLADGTSEVQVRGTNLMRGYLDDAAGSAAALTTDGWLRTGDVGALDAAGNLRIVDRIKDIILRGGTTIHPAEVEAVLARHPEVAAVAVVGRPHAHLGEEVVAHVVRAPGTQVDAATLTAWCTTRLSSYKVPAAVVFHTELPLGPSGKVLKRRLREGFGLPVAGAGQ